jgi:hypothetical protein
MLGFSVWSLTSFDHSLKHNDRVETVSDHLQRCTVKLDEEHPAHAGLGQENGFGFA